MSAVETRVVIEILGPVLALAGTGVSVLGTYLLSGAVYPLVGMGFAKVAFKTSVLFLLLRATEAREKIELLSDLSDHNDRVGELSGVFLLFWGFAAQGVGAVLWLVAAIWTALERLHWIASMS